MKEHRGTGILFLCAAVIVAVTGAVAYRAMRRVPPTPSFLIFHWIPNPASETLKIVGPGGGDVSDELDPQLLKVIRRAVSGELRVVGALPSSVLTRPQAAALLLQDLPEKERSLPLFDSREAVYVQAGTGYSFHPGPPVALNESITMALAGRSAGSTEMRVFRSSGGSGTFTLRWW